MLTLEPSITELLAWGTLVFHIALAALVALWLREWKTGATHPALALVRTHALKLGFLLALTASALTLLYSEIFGFTPCGLCWLQRVFLYSQTVVLALALWKNDRGVADYVIALSIPGLLVALYQHFIQMGGADVLPCPAASGGADCAARIVFEFGYITFPLMSATAFTALILLSLILRRR